MESTWHLRVTPDLRRAVEKVASTEDRSLSAAVRQLVREALRARVADTESQPRSNPA
jgi:hypothetical protein